MILRPIGTLHTPFRTVADCPRNGRQLDPAPACVAAVDAAYQPGLLALDGFTHLILLYWLGPQRDDLHITPPFDGQPRGVFATRAPLRPNPVGLSVVAFGGMDGPGRLRVRHLDCVDGTPLLDIKPYLPSTDAEPEAAMGWLAPHRTARGASGQGAAGRDAPTQSAPIQGTTTQGAATWDAAAWNAETGGAASQRAPSGSGA